MNLRGAWAQSRPGDQGRFVELSDEIGEFAKHVLLKPKNPMPQ